KPLIGSPRTETSVVNGTYKGFMEIMLQNNDTKMHTYHMSGYAFVVVRMDFGDWSENSRGTYNKWDGIARTTAQVYFYLRYVWLLLNTKIIETFMLSKMSNASLEPQFCSYHRSIIFC
ncbi:Monocopper oxidase-like protein SKU5, partial [Glycine soja]